jgi:hypothetical protein
MALRNKVLAVGLILSITLPCMAGMWMASPGKGSHAVVAAGGVEGFEGTGAPAGWATSGADIDYDSTASPITGAQSLAMADPVGADQSATYDFPEDADTVWIAFKYRESADPAVSTGEFCRLLNSSNTVLAFWRTQTNGTLVFRVTSTNSTTVVDMTANTVYRVKMKYTKGTGADETLEMWAVTDGSGSWGTSQILTNGADTTRADKLQFNQAANNNITMTWDNVKVSTSDIAIADID